MKKHIYILLMIVVYAATSLAQVEEGVWYRIKDVESNTYMSAENYEEHHVSIRLYIFYSVPNSLLYLSQ